MNNQSRSHTARFIATVGGLGYLRPGPGTYASIAAVLCWLAASRSLFDHALTIATLVTVLVLTHVGVRVSTRVARDANQEDPQFIVLDEFAGQIIALIALRPTILHAVIALVAFRLFDITKPWPVRSLENLPDGFGIMADDLMAGVYAFIVTHVIAHWL
jgi:phosphatidylglycerophosphatase A